MGILNVLLGDLASPAEMLHAKTEEEVHGLVMNVGHAGEEIQEIVAFAQKFQWLGVDTYFPRHS